MTQRAQMVRRFSEAGIRAVFAGHYHRNAGGQYEEMEVVVTSAMGAQNSGRGVAPDKSGYRIVEVSERELCHRYVEIERP